MSVLLSFIICMLTVEVLQPCKVNFAMSGALFPVSCSTQRTPSPLDVNRKPFKFSIQPSSVKPFLSNKVALLKINVPEIVSDASVKFVDWLVDSIFEFVPEPLLSSQSNFEPVEEIGEAVQVNTTQGIIPDDFPEGVYIRNGSNPMFGGFKSAVSVFGKTSNVWIEGEGMLHVIYFNKDVNGNWITNYRNKYVETKTFKIENERNRRCFLPAVEGDAPAVLSSFFLNMVRYGIPDKIMSNTNVIEHAGRLFSIAENYVPQEIDITTLKTIGDWDVNGNWIRPFTSHPKRAPGTGELVTMGADAKKPYFEVGVVSADGTKLVHKVDLKFDRSTLTHEIGVTQRYNVILDFPLIVDVSRVLKGGSLIKYEKERFARIGVMPRYGNADSVKWFNVESSAAFHIINCYEHGEDEVVVMVCKARESIIPGPDLGKNKFEWFSNGLKHINTVIKHENDQDGALFARPFKWTLHMKTGEVIEGINLTGREFSLDFPMINPSFTGLQNKYAYTQVVDSSASTTAGMAKYGGLTKLYLQERKTDDCFTENGKIIEEKIKVEYHMFPKSTYCSGATFVAKSGAIEEDDGWIITFVHNEDTATSQVYIVDTKKFTGEPVAIITMPYRVPYGFHGTFTHAT